MGTPHYSTFLENYELDEAHYEEILNVIREHSGPNDKIIKHELYEITRKSFERLNPGVWLNDEIMNGYVSLINKRCRSTETGDRRTCFAFYTTFYTMLTDMNRLGTYNFRKLQRIVEKQKVNLRTLKTILIPINLTDSHWLLMSLDLTENIFYIIDSMGSSKQSAEHYVNVVRQFLQEYFHATKSESKSTIRKSFQPAAFDDNLANWKIVTPKDVTRQINGSDCGMHTCINMELLSRGPSDHALLNYPMDPDISMQTRKKMQIELLIGKLI